jgi:hypothetical protein
MDKVKTPISRRVAVLPPARPGTRARRTPNTRSLSDRDRRKCSPPSKTGTGPNRHGVSFISSTNYSFSRTDTHAARPLKSFRCIRLASSGLTTGTHGSQYRPPTLATNLQNSVFPSCPFTYPHVYLALPKFRLIHASFCRIILLSRPTGKAPQPRGFAASQGAPHL